MLLAFGAIYAFGQYLNNAQEQKKVQLASYVSAVDSLVPMVVAEKKKTTEDSLKYLIDSLKTKLFLSEYKVKKVKFYTAIVDNKPSQLKFYKGWIKRAIK